MFKASPRKPRTAGRKKRTPEVKRDQVKRLRSFGGKDEGLSQIHELGGCHRESSGLRNQERKKRRERKERGFPEEGKSAPD